MGLVQIWAIPTTNILDQGIDKIILLEEVNNQLYFSWA
jgi:hypothetical protein